MKKTWSYKNIFFRGLIIQDKLCINYIQSIEKQCFMYNNYNIIKQQL